MVGRQAGALCGRWGWPGRVRAGNHAELSRWPPLRNSRWRGRPASRPRELLVPRPLAVPRTARTRCGVPQERGCRRGGRLEPSSEPGAGEAGQPPE